MGKTCRACLAAKPEDGFCSDRKRKDGRSVYCRECSAAKSKARRTDVVRENERRYRNRNRVAVKARETRYHLRRRYGMTEEAYRALVVAQAGRCAACRDTPAPDARLEVDHDHADGRVRGLLCGPCNRALGHLRDSPLRIAGLLAYAERIALRVVKHG